MLEEKLKESQLVSLSLSFCALVLIQIFLFQLKHTHHLQFIFSSKTFHAIQSISVHLVVCTNQKQSSLDLFHCIIQASLFLSFFFFGMWCITEIERIQKGEPKKDGETYLDLFTTKNVRVKERVLIPVKQYPRVSVWKGIGSKQGTLCSISILTFV